MEKVKMDKFAYFSKSANKLPGKGTGEYVSNPKNYEQLSKINNWRRVLSNFHKCPFTYNNLLYNTIEHAFQAAKIDLVDKDKSFQFSLDSGSELSKSEGLAARKKRKWVMLGQETIKIWNNKSDDIMKEITEDKIKKCPEYVNVLVLTGNAELWHIMPRQAKKRQYYLENIRDSLFNLETSTSISFNENFPIDTTASTSTSIVTNTIVSTIVADSNNINSQYDISRVSDERSTKTNNYYTVLELKKICKQLKIKCSGLNKSQIVDKIKCHDNDH